ncbi:LamB/YcsF family protein [Actinomadura rubrisoli]
MDATVAACAQRGIGISAHPGFPDLVGFGRRAMDPTAVRSSTSRGSKMMLLRNRA